MVTLAHAGHTIVQLLYAAPVLVMAMALVVVGATAREPEQATRLVPPTSQATTEEKS
jgi:hypothetical protein